MHLDLELLLGRSLLAEGLGEVIPEGYRTKYSKRALHFFGTIIFLFMFLLFGATLLGLYQVPQAFLYSVLIFANAILVEALVQIILQRSTIKVSLFERSFVERFNFVFLVTITTQFFVLVSLKVPLADLTPVRQLFILFILGVLILYFNFRDPIRWESYDNLVEFIRTFFLQLSGTLTRWIVLLSQAIVVSLVITLVSEELWLVVAQLQLSRLLFVCGLLVLISLGFGYARVTRLINSMLSELTPSEDIDPLPLSLHLLLTQHRRLSNSFRGALGRVLSNESLSVSPAPGYFKALVLLRDSSKWKFNAYTLQSIKSILTQDYSARAGISLMASSTLTGLFIFCVLLLFLAVTIPEKAITAWTNTEGAVLATAIDSEVALSTELTQLVAVEWNSIFHEPVPKMALLGTSIMISLLLLDAGTKRDSILKLLGLTDNLIAQHFAVSLMYRWSTECDYQLIGSRLVGLRSNNGIDGLPCAFVLLEEAITPERMQQIAMELGEQRLSLRTYFAILFMDDQAFVDLSLKRRMQPIGRMQTRLNSLRVEDLGNTGHFWLWLNESRSIIEYSESDSVWDYLINAQLIK